MFIAVKADDIEFLRKVLNKHFKILLMIALIVSFTTTISGQNIIYKSDGDTPFFNTGMFSVVGGMEGAPQPGSQEFRDDLLNIYNGTNNGLHPINILQTYGHYISDTDFWEAYLNDIDFVSGSLKTLGDCQFIYIDTDNDSSLSEAEINSFKVILSDFINNPNSNHIAGWYIADEPSSHGYDSLEVLKIYNAIKEIDDRPVYIAEAAATPNFAKFMCDVLLIDYYFYSVNDFTDWATLSLWKDIIYGARSDLRTAGREGTQLQALLVLGEELFPDILNEDVIATHGLTHAAIKRVLDLGVEGIWFYAWRAGTIDSEDAVNRWLTQQLYAEAVETEIHDHDFLITSFTNQTESKLIISDVGNNQSPDEGDSFPFSNRITALTVDDFQGSDNLDGSPVLYDLSYRIDEGYRSNSDGDDELITVFDNGSIFFNEGGDKPDDVLIDTSQENIPAITSGDFDGDGDDEIVTAIQNGGGCKIYVSDDAAVGSITQYQIYASDEFTVTALTSGDFNGDGRDELVTAVSSTQTGQSFIYIDDISSTGNCCNGTPWLEIGNYKTITALTAGDFEHDRIYKDRLIFAISDSTLKNTSIYYTDSENFSFDSSHVFFGPDDHWHVTAMTIGDFKDDLIREDELIISLSNSLFNHTKIYRTENPVTKGIGSEIYDPGFPSSYFVSAMSTGSFRESLHPNITNIEDNPGTHSTVVDDFILYQNYPNPFNPSTKIKFQIPSAEKYRDASLQTTLKVYDILGNEVTTLVNEQKSAGTYEINFDAGGLPSGVYFYRLTAGSFSASKKLLLLK